MNAQSPWTPWFTPSDASVEEDGLEVGDVVTLRGQGQLMTVEDYCDDCGAVDVVWFAGNDEEGWTGPHRDTFDVAMLDNLDDGSPT